MASTAPPAAPTAIPMMAPVARPSSAAEEIGENEKYVHNYQGFIQNISVGVGKNMCIEPRPLGGGVG